MRYWPDPSVTPLRAFSISAELLASTVTPGNTPPDGSRTIPASVVWAWANVGRTRNAKRDNERATDLIETPLPHESLRPTNRQPLRFRDMLPGPPALGQREI